MKQMKIWLVMEKGEQAQTAWTPESGETRPEPNNE
jgi:hypothetical protein